MNELLKRVGDIVTALLPERNVDALAYADFEVEHWSAKSVLVIPAGWSWLRTNKGGVGRIFRVGVVLLDQIIVEDDLKLLDMDMNIIATAMLLDEDDALGDYVCKEVEDIAAAELNPALATAWAHALQLTFQK